MRIKKIWKISTKNAHRSKIKWEKRRNFEIKKKYIKKNVHPQKRKKRSKKNHQMWMSRKKRSKKRAEEERKGKKLNL